MTVPVRTAKSRRGSRRPGWALLTALLVLAIGAGVAVIFTDKPIYLRIGVVLGLWAAIIAAFAALTYRRQSDADQAKVRDQKLVYDLQLEREISARREYELTVENRLRQELASEVEAQTADEVATLRAELAALRTNLEILFNADLGSRPAIEHDPIRALGPWPGAEPEPVEPVAPRFTTATRESVDSEAVTAYQDFVVEDDSDDDETRTAENPIIDVSEDPHHVDDEDTSTPPYPEPAVYYGAQAHEPEPYRPPTPSGSHWMSEPERQPQPEPEPLAWSAQAEDWDAAADGEDWDPVPQPMAPPEQPAAAHPVWAPDPQAAQWGTTPGSGWAPAPAEGQWLPAGSDGSNWAPSQQEAPLQSGYPVEQPQPRGRHSGTPSRHQAQAGAGGGHWAPEPVGGGYSVPEPVSGGHSAPEPVSGGHSAPEQPPVEPEPTPSEPEQDIVDPKGKRRAEETGGHSVADLLGRLQAESTPSGGGGGGKRRKRDS